MGGAVFVVKGGSLTINDAGSISSGALTGGSGANAGSTYGSGIFVQGSTLTFGGTGTYTVADVIADQNGSGGAGANDGLGGTGGASAIVKTGTGTLLLNGTNTYTGGTTVNAGTLGGTGTIGALTVNSGGTLAPGASAGNLTVGNVSLVTGATFAVEIGGTNGGVNYDQLDVNGTVSLGGATLQLSFLSFTPATGQSFVIVNNNETADPVTGQFAQGASIAIAGNSYSINYAGGDGNDVVLTALNDSPAVSGPVTLAAIDEDSGARLITQAELLANSSDIDGPPLVAANLTIATGLGSLTNNGNGTWSYNPAPNDDTQMSFSYQVTDGTTPVAASASLDINPVPDEPPIRAGTAGDDTFDAPAGASHFAADGGIDTMRFGFRLVDAEVTYDGNKVIIDGPGSHTVLNGFERFAFTDGTVDNNDGNWLVDDLFYYSTYHDVWNAHVDADVHYNSNGWHEWRDPSAFFSTSLYRAAYQDVTGNPLDHWHAAGWSDGRVPSFTFDAREYLADYPDVAAAHVDPLEHFLHYGAQEGREPTAPTGLIAANGFDYIYYLKNNPDVLAAHIDPLEHFNTHGWHEGRNPNAFFDTNGYLATYGDVAAAGVNPLDHYHHYGWAEGRDPSVDFDTGTYLATYSDVAAAHIDPLRHFLQDGIHEGRSPFGDSLWG
jgi:autotransporter-associated beta strand protein